MDWPPPPIRQDAEPGFKLCDECFGVCWRGHGDAHAFLVHTHGDQASGGFCLVCGGAGQLPLTPEASARWRTFVPPAYARPR